MVTLKELLEQRTNTYLDLTKIILNELQNVTESAEQLLVDQNEPNGTFTWKDVDIIKEENLVVILGDLTYPPGTTVITQSGEVVTITEETSPYFFRTFRVGVPYSLAINGTVDQIKEFLKASEAAEASQMSSFNDADFDRSTLSEEQQEQLRLFELTHGDDVE